ncbi:MAG TPA: MscL family protein [Oligoflexia bacterium]|nr:MscL family protein [Oligoflexia bacterium]
MSFSTKEFIDFLKKYQVIGLAIAVIIGGKLNEFVSTLVNDLLVPLIFQPALKAARVDDIRSLSFHGIKYGKVMGAFIDFAIVAFVVYLISKFILREKEVTKK